MKQMNRGRRFVYVYKIANYATRGVRSMRLGSTRLRTMQLPERRTHFMFVFQYCLYCSASIIFYLVRFVYVCHLHSVIPSKERCPTRGSKT